MARSPARLALLAFAPALALAGCGQQRQDANAPSGQFALEVTRASFPADQQIAEQTTLALEIANRGDRTVPNVAVTIATEPRTAGQAPVAFAQRRDAPALADSGRPVWIVDDGPAGGESAYSNTWAVGPLAQGQTRTVEWKLTAVQRGRFTVAWRLAPALVGDVELAGGRTRGEFAVAIAGKPVAARVDGDGDVVRSGR